jgi:hypothetical protein
MLSFFLCWRLLQGMWDICHSNHKNLNHATTTHAVIWRVFAYPKTERYYSSRLCFEIARQFRLSTELF